MQPLITQQEIDDMGTFLHLLETATVPQAERLIDGCQRFLTAHGWAYQEAENMANLLPASFRRSMFCSLAFADYDNKIVGAIPTFSAGTRALNLLHECAHVYEFTYDRSNMVFLRNFYGYHVSEWRAELMAHMVNTTLGGDSRACTKHYLDIWYHGYVIPRENTHGWVEKNVQEFMHLLM
jgi:hypothetical protein